MVNRRTQVCVVTALLAAGVIVGAAENVRIVPIVSDNQVLVSVDLAEAYTDAVRDAVSSGLRTTFTYDLELRMIVPVWVDRTIATSVVSTSDRYDNLTRRHTLSRIVDGRSDASLVTEDEAVARTWLTSLNRLPLCKTSKLETNRDYYVRIRARSRPSGGSLLGWISAISGQARFTFIP
jgi:Domain of unknown function (DUF4390)